MLLERQKFEFADFLLDAKENVLLRDGKPLSITPKAFQLLLVLVKNHGHLVEKDELLNTVWADSFVEEGNLAFTIGLLRKVLNDNAQKPQFIETVPRRGYRFIGKLNENGQTPFEIISEPFSEEAVDLLEFSPDANGKATVEKTDVVDSPDRNRMIAAIGVIALLVGAFALGYYFFSSRNAVADENKSIAVLPLKPINAAKRDELYEVGVADSLIHRLSSVKGFVVRPLNAVRKYADIEQDPLAAGREQQVDYVLASNYQLAGGRIRVTAQLYKVANGEIEETYKSEKDTANIFAMQDAIAGEVGNMLMARFAASSNRPKTERGTMNEEAYRLYLQGMYLYDKRNAADLQKAAQFLEQAVRLDPNYAQAWAGKAHLHRTISNFGRAVNTHEENLKSIEATNKALALDPNLSDAHSALCEAKFFYEYDFDGAESDCRRAVELAPNSSLARQINSRFLMGRGRFDEAVAEIKTAIDLEPTSLFNQRLLGNCLLNSRRYDEAVVQFRRVAAMDENFGSTYFWLSMTLGLQGKESEAFEMSLKHLATQNADEETVRAFQKAFQTSGWQGVLRERINRFEKSNEIYYHGAAYNALTGYKNKAFELLEKSYQRREWGMHLLEVDPRLDNLRDDPRYGELVKRVNSK